MGLVIKTLLSMPFWTLPFPVVKCAWKAGFCGSNVSPVLLTDSRATYSGHSVKTCGLLLVTNVQIFELCCLIFLHKGCSSCFSVCAFFSWNLDTAFWWVSQNTDQRASLVRKCQGHLMRVYISTASVLRLFHSSAVSTAVWNLTVTTHYRTHNCNVIIVFIMFIFHITKLIMSNIDKTKNSIRHTFLKTERELPEEKVKGVESSNCIHQQKGGFV